MKKSLELALVAMVLLVGTCAILMVGCRRKDEAMRLHFVFQDARGIQVGDRVMGDGIEVGRVIAPPESTKPRHVVVSVSIMGLSPEKQAYLTKDLTAVIRKDSLVAGQTYLELIFPSSPGNTVESGTILKGRGGLGETIDLSGISLPKDPQQFLALIQKGFVVVDPEMAGATVFYLNWISLALAIITILSLMLDFLLRLPQGSKRERPSPKILYKIWVVFCIILILRFFLGLARVLGGLDIISVNLLASLAIIPIDIMGLIAQEWPFITLSLALIAIRFKFELLMLSGRK